MVTMMSRTRCAPCTAPAAARGHARGFGIGHRQGGQAKRTAPRGVRRRGREERQARAEGGPRAASA
ncbi:hypothetical protein BED46_011560 [Burkholderia contaminans]|uniref:Uncharacterized protein n=1 Tax=Burkholderia contaminans LMG 23361 TaxID=1334628 RepID=A0ABD4AKM8_9BURK|nr:hypothetical protein WR31_31955 [Burkholderia contaminans LMG 23361]MBA9836062.1 hypothetical protein [Burkholderia contaminans]MBA9861610.1 hypothetical protein [Burkholderia contaminans]MBA9928133.1 hypothetical protein [Burkholderia contaminans]MCB4325050.1 hypothetical protein [Burkholderia contaminans]